MDDAKADNDAAPNRPGEPTVVAPARAALARWQGRARPRLRFDKVALALVADLRAALAPAIADGTAVAITGTAPIRLSGKSTAALAALLRARLADPSAQGDLEAGLFGNQVRARMVGGLAAGAPKLIGFVHNPDPHAEGLLDLGVALATAAGAAGSAPGGRPAPRLVIDDADTRLPTPAWRQVCVQLSPPIDLSRIRLARAGGVIEPLTDG